MEQLDNLRWKKSSYSGNGGDCVEVGTGLPGEVAVRDSKDREAPKLIVSGNAWSQFTEAIKHGEFDL
jgi:Domain of unknown function (DUF397)